MTKYYVEVCDREYPDEEHEIYFVSSYEEAKELAYYCNHLGQDAYVKILSK